MAKPVPNTLEEQLMLDGVDIESKSADYHPMLALVEVMLGYKPKVNGLCQVWAPGFQTFHLLFKHSTGMPMSMMGYPPLIRDLFLAMYVSSRETGCEYCTAHTAAVALRRGALPERITTLLGMHGDDSDSGTESGGGPSQRLDAKDEALYQMAQALSRHRPELGENHIAKMRKFFSESEVEWVARSIALMGFLNLLTSSFGLILEDTPLQEAAPILAPTGWKPGMHGPNGYESPSEEPQDDDDENDAPPSPLSLPPQDTLSTYIRMMSHAPKAMRLESEWLAGVPATWPKAGSFLQDRTGHKFAPILDHISRRPTKSSSTLRAYTAIVRDHFDPQQSEIGRVTKAIVGLVYATVVDDESLMAESRTLALLFADEELSYVDDRTLDKIIELVARKQPPATSQACSTLLLKLMMLPGVTSSQMAAAIVLARAASTRPTWISPVIVSDVAVMLSPAARVETILWVGLQQSFVRMLHFSTVNESLAKLRSWQKENKRRNRKASMSKSCTSVTASASGSYRSAELSVADKLPPEARPRTMSSSSEEDYPLDGNRSEHATTKKKKTGIIRLLKSRRIRRSQTADL